MDVHNEDLLRFWKYLHEYKVRYIMVGGFATRFHGYNRATDDIDMWLEDTLANRQKLRAAFKALGYGDFPSLEKMQFVPGWTNFYVGDGIVLDIMTSMKGLEEFTFEQCFTEASIAEIDDVEIPFLHINQLILNKKAVYRPKDKVDVQELEKIKKLREEER